MESRGAVGDLQRHRHRQLSWTAADRQTVSDADAGLFSVKDQVIVHSRPIYDFTTSGQIGVLKTKPV
jgi:hypothetical protein